MQRFPQGHPAHAVLARGLEAIAWSTLLVWLLAYVSLGYPWTMVGVYTDGLSYLSIADAMRGVGDPDSAAGLQALRGGRFPPGYPAYLSLFGADNSATGMRLANLAQMLSVLLMAAIVFAYLRSCSGSRRLALLGLLYVLSLPFVQPWSLELTSEPLFVAVTVAACWIAGFGTMPRRWIWVAALIACACLIRMLGLVLLAALVLWTWRAERSWVRALAAGAIAALPIAAWLAFQWHAGLRADATYIGEFSSASRSMPPLSPAILLASLDGLLGAFAPRYFPHPLAAVFAALLLVAAGARARWDSLGDLPTLATGLLLVTLLSWPYPDHLHRLAGPVAPLLAALALRAGAKTALPRNWDATIRACLLAGAGAGFLLGTLRLARAHVEISDPALVPYARNVVTHNRTQPMREVENFHLILLAAEQSARLVGPADCMTTTLPALVRLRAPEQVRTLRQPFDWASNGCAYVLAINATFAGTPALYPMQEPGIRYDPVLVSRFPDGPIAAALIRRPAAGTPDSGPALPERAH